jgi:SOUL heme-binding protein
MTRFKKRALYGLGMLAVAFPIITLSGCNMGQYAEPAHTAQQFEGGIEIRDYKPMIAAEVEVTGPRQEAISKGFRLIADYIFGNNEPKATIAMTTPVIQQAEEKRCEKIAMTTPVIQQGDGQRWKVQFIMPAEYTLETLPKPVNKAVKLKEVAGKKMVAIRFSGSTGDDTKMAAKRAELEAYVKANNLKTTGEPVMAFYDPPWTLPFFRRNEIMLELK